MGAHDWIGNLVQNGTIDPLQLTDDTRAAFDPLAVKGVTYNGQIYGIPYAIENVVLFRNTDLVPEAPRTMEELVAKGKELKAAGKVDEIMALPVGANGDAYHMYPIYASAGAYLFGRTAEGDYDPTTWAWPSRRPPGRSPRSTTWAGRARGRSSARSRPRTSPACSPARRPPSCCRGPGRSPTCRRAASTTPSPPSPGSRAARRRGRSSASRPCTWPARAASSRWPRSSPPTTSSSRGWRSPSTGPTAVPLPSRRRSRRSAGATRTWPGSGRPAGTATSCRPSRRWPRSGTRSARPRRPWSAAPRRSQRWPPRPRRSRPRLSSQGRPTWRKAHRSLSRPAPLERRPATRPASPARVDHHRRHDRQDRRAGPRPGHRHLRRIPPDRAAPVARAGPARPGHGGAVLGLPLAPPHPGQVPGPGDPVPAGLPGLPGALHHEHRVHELRGRPPGRQAGRDPGHRGGLGDQGPRLDRLPAVGRHQ